MPPFAAAARLLLATLIGAIVLFAAAAPSRAADGVTLEATALLGGHVRPGAWAAVRVIVTNDGPDIQGELRIRTTQQGRSVYGIEAELASGARKEFTLYAQPPLFGSRLVIELVSGETSLASDEVSIRSHDLYTPVVGIVAERPEAIQRDVADAVHSPNWGSTPTVIPLRPADLPARVEAWAALDRLVWQDVDAAQLEQAQVEALGLWLAAGGQLVVLGGSTGPASLRAFPDELVPFVAQLTVDVPRAELAALLGNLPANATSLPALAGTLREGTVLGRSGDHVYAARLTHGQGAVTLVGIDPGTSWLARSDAAGSLWRRLLPTAAGPVSNPFIVPDEGYLIQNALYNLPSVALPPIEQLFVLLIAYIALIGPVNYLVLRRLDRREWAWLTMPLLVGVFAVASYGLGATIKGSDVIVNQVAIVRAGEDTARGMGQVYVGVFSPSRRNFEVRIPGGALLSSPSSPSFSGGQAEQPIDALFGDITSRLRNFEVGFGVIRGFRADTATDAPSVGSDLRLVGGRVVGSVTNNSDTDLEHVAVVFAGGVKVLPRLAAGETQQVELRPSGGEHYSLSQQIFGTSFSRDPVEQRTINTRRAVIDQLTGGYGMRVVGASPHVPLLLAWQPAPALDVELVGERPNHVGNSLFVVPLSVAYDRQALFEDSLLVRTVVDAGAEQGWEPNSYYLERGTMVLELRPAGLADRFTVTSLEMALSQGGMITLRGNGQPVGPLPDNEQPPQDDPLGDPPAGKDPFGRDDPFGEDDPIGRPAPWEPDWRALPEIQLFDYAAGLWYELESFEDSRAYMVSEPERWVDDSGRVLILLVNRDGWGEGKWFQLVARMEGTIE